MRTRLVLLRHGETDWNALDIFQGQADQPLNALGEAQARAAAPGVAGLRPGALYASDLGRARQTAAEIAVLTGLEVLTDERLREIDCGTWSGKSGAEISALVPEYAGWAASGRDFRRSATGETEAEVADRVAPALDELLTRHAGETIAVVGHGLAIRVGVARLLGFPGALASTLGTMLNCHYAIVVRSGERTRLSAYNVGPGHGAPGSDSQPVQ